METTTGTPYDSEFEEEPNECEKCGWTSYSYSTELCAALSTSWSEYFCYDCYSPTQTPCYCGVPSENIMNGVWCCNEHDNWPGDMRPKPANKEVCFSPPLSFFIFIFDFDLVLIDYAVLGRERRGERARRRPGIDTYR